MSHALILYGIHNCDTVKKARRWLDERGTTYCYHDFRKDGLTSGQVQQWLKAVGADALINRRGTTYRQLDEAGKLRLDSDPVGLLCEQPALIKRPVVEHNGRIGVGFSEAAFRQRFS